MNKLIQLAKEIAIANAKINDFEFRLDNQKSDLEARKLALVPEQGWPGKNEGERKLAEKSAVMSDEACQNIEKNIFGFREALVTLKSEVSALETERRALEWSIRLAYVQSLGAKVDDALFEEIGGADPVVEIDDEIEGAELAAAVTNDRPDFYDILDELQENENDDIPF